MKVLNAAQASWRAAILAIVMTAALAGSASAAVNEITIDPTAALSPGHLQATLTGTIACGSGSTLYLNAEIVQPRTTSGYGYTTVTCDGTAQAYAIDVSAGGFGAPGVFKPGRASARVSTYVCDEFTCTPTSVDAIIRLTN
jgi:hypothetical protein